MSHIYLKQTLNTFTGHLNDCAVRTMDLAERWSCFFTEVKTDGATKWVWLHVDAMNQRTKEPMNAFISNGKSLTINAVCFWKTTRSPPANSTTPTPSVDKHQPQFDEHVSPFCHRSTKRHLRSQPDISQCLFLLNVNKLLSSLKFSQRWGL